MNIYIPIEVKSRELEGRMLLALAAAERGHQVLIGRKADTISLAENGVLRPGIVHDKCLTPSEWKVDYIRKLAVNGHVVTSQDEESGLLEPTYEEFAVNRYSETTVARAERIFTWGQFERDGLTRMFPAAAEKFEVTGSPRVDFWRPEFSDYFPERPESILIVSNFGWLVGINPFWVKLKLMRENAYFRSVEDEYRRLAFCSWQMSLLEQFLRLIREIARAYPDRLVVVRPHPIDDIEAWRTLVGGRQNVVVRGDGSASSWIRSAKLLIHNGCTTALEAAAVGVPTLAFRPVPSPFELDYPNSVSRCAESIPDAISFIGDVLKASESERPAGLDGARDILARKIGNLDGPLAADRIADAWDRLNDPRLEQQNRWGYIRNRIRAIETRSRVWRAVSGRLLGPPPTGKFRTAHKFLPLQDGEVREVVDGLRRVLDRFYDVRVERMGQKTFLVQPASRRGM